MYLFTPNSLTPHIEILDGLPLLDLGEGGEDFVLNWRPT